MTTQTKYRKYDSESDYYAMGYRMYSPEFGRFLAVDPLFEAMPRHNPYHYSYNSPMFWSDPSGLVPVKEKVKNSERLQALELDWGRINDIYNQITSENYRYASAISTKGVFAFFGKNLNVILFGATTALARTGEQAVGEKGILLTDERKANIRSHFSFCYDNDENAPEVLKERFFEELFGRLGNKISEDNYNFLTSVDHTINLYSPEAWLDFLKTQKDLSSWWDILIDNIGEFFGGEPHKPQYGMAYSGNHNLHFHADMFTNVNFDLSKYKIEGPTFLGLGYLEPHSNKLSDIILHELGHSWALYVNGNEYNSWHWRYKENWAIQYNNQFRSSYLQGYTNETWYWPFKGKNP